MRDIVTRFCSDCISDNLYILNLFYKTLVEIQNAPPSKREELTHKLDNIINENPSPAACQTLYKSEIPAHIDIQQILYSRVKSYEQLAQLREILHEDLVALLEVLWDLVLKGADPQGRRLEYTASLVKHILKEFPKKKIYRTDILIATDPSDRIDAYDVLLNFIELFVGNYDPGEHVISYLKIAKALFLYQAKRLKDKEARASALIAAFHVLLTRQVNTESSQSQTHQLPVSTQESIYDRIKTRPYEYLKAITHLDPNSPSPTHRKHQHIERWIYEQKAINVPQSSQHLLYTADTTPRVSITKTI